MAGALVGGAFLSAFLQVAFDRVASHEVLDYLKGRKLIDGLLQKLKIELMSADAVLIDAEEKQITNPAVKKWLDELKDAVYVADDLLDEIAYEALRCKLEAESTSKVMGFISTFVNSFDRRIQSELEKVLNTLEYITKRKDVLCLKEVVGRVPSRPMTTSCPEEYGVFGREKDKEAIFKKFQSDDASVDGICVVPIVGMGGVGKTTLARFIYNDKWVDNFDHKAWVCVSENFDSFMIAKTIFERVTLSACDIQNMDLLQIRIREKFMEKKIFLVLDDVWSENYDDWVELLKMFRCGAQEIKIIVTTRSKKVASNVCTIPTYLLKQLSNDECWSLFEKHAFKNGNADEFPNLKEIGRQIVQKCKGLPLAAKALGEGNNSILPALRLSYHYLPSHLKRCFAYCSILPKDYEFKKEELVLLWMAEDLLLQSKGNGRMEEIGEWYFDDLVSRSFFQQSSTYRSSFIMHDLVNDLAKFISGEFCFRLEIDESCEINLKTRHFSYVRTEFDAFKKFKVSHKARDLRTFFGLDFSPYAWGRNSISTMMIDDLLLKFKCLRVLSFSTYKNMKHLPTSVGNLKHLRYLDLSHTSIKQLPDSVCSLYNLQTLLLSECKSLTELPTKMERLVNLRHLDISRTNLKEMPLQMGKLRNLQKLTTFVVGKHSGSSIKELRELQHLSGSLSILNLQNVLNDKDGMEVKLKDKQDLSELVFQWGRDSDNSQNERNLLEQLRPHEKLKCLTIQNYGGTRFPNWLEDCSFSNMASIRLANCKYCFSLPPLGHLTVLKRLSIEGFHAVSHVGREFYGGGASSAIDPFRSLEELSFEDMPEWQEWFLFEDKNEGGVFSTLRQLRIIKCPKLCRGLPNHLPSLTYLKINECQQLATSLPRTPALRSLELNDCEKVLLKELQPKLVTLKIGGPTTTLKSIEGITTHYYSSLRRLTITSGCDSLWSFPLEFYTKLEYFFVSKSENLESLSVSEGSHRDLTSLTTLEIEFCPNFVSFANGGLCAPNLTFISICTCKKLKSLPEGMHILLPSLVVLELYSCPELESFPQGGLPSNLVTLHIDDCDKLISNRMGWGLQSLHSLRKFKVMSNYEEVESFPEKALLPPTLTDFSISFFPKLKSLKVFQHLTSLQRLEIEYCHNLQCLPEEGLPISLSYLILNGCPLLEQRCQRDKGEDWPKIAHIPFIKINSDVIT
uniref:Disease resistance RPP13-like protein 1 n=1 Tax=Fagus sylvatica TaxID=28930 RepID=A0A2N9HL93_FAGSY